MNLWSWGRLCVIKEKLDKHQLKNQLAIVLSHTCRPRNFAIKIQALSARPSPFLITITKKTFLSKVLKSWQRSLRLILNGCNRQFSLLSWAIAHWEKIIAMSKLMLFLFTTLFRAVTYSYHQPRNNR